MIRILLFCWIPQHIEIIDNEKTDERCYFTSRNFYSPSGHWFMRQNSWVCGKTDGIRISTISKLNSFRSTTCGFKSHLLRRKFNDELASLRFGHTHFPRKLLLLSEPAPTCLACSKNSSVRHILNKYPAFRNFRQKHSGKVKIPLQVYNLYIYIGFMNFFWLYCFTHFSCAL